MSFLGTRNAVAIGVSQHLTLGGPDLLSKLSPSLILQFAGAQTMDPRITFTRSTTATFTGSNGLIQTAAIDAPRFDYNPVTRAPLGLLIEEQRTNLLLQSADLFETGTGAVNWFYVSGTVASDTQVAPDGTTTADTLTTTGGAQSIYQSATVSASTTYTFSVYVRFGTMLADFYKIAVFNNSTPGFIAADVVPTQTPTATGWTRIQYSFTTPAGCTSVRVYPFRNSSGLDSCTVFLWGAQLEAGAFPTSYIPTVASQVTHAIDAAAMTETNFSDWYNQTEGTLFGEFSVPPSLTNFPNTIGAASDGTTLNQIAAYAHTSGLYVNIKTGGVLQGDPGVLGSPVTAANAKFAHAYQVNNCVSAWNGVSGTPDTSVTLPTVNQFRIGTNGAGTGALNSHIRKIAYYPRRLSNAALQGITS